MGLAVGKVIIMSLFGGEGVKATVAHVGLALQLVLWDTRRDMSRIHV